MATGAETFIYSNGSIKARKLAKKVQEGLKLGRFKDRGVKTANFYVLRETKMPAILIEIGFIDNTFDNILFDNRTSQIVHEISKAIILETKE